MMLKTLVLWLGVWLFLSTPKVLGLIPEHGQKKKFFFFVTVPLFFRTRNSGEMQEGVLLAWFLSLSPLPSHPHAFIP
jgi:hypothetical protein